MLIPLRESALDGTSFLSTGQADYSVSSSQFTGLFAVSDHIHASWMLEDQCFLWDNPGDWQATNNYWRNWMDDNKRKALSAALGQIEKQFGKGAVMRMGDVAAARDIDAISTGSLGLDIALGIG